MVEKSWQEEEQEAELVSAHNSKDKKCRQMPCACGIFCLSARFFDKMVPNSMKSVGLAEYVRENAWLFR
ncbi:MAG: hypothetical protein J6K51_06700 [Clostridia bacterium]|nr:hypothetical protein [Clostridia bacterium]